MNCNLFLPTHDYHLNLSCEQTIARFMKFACLAINMSIFNHFPFKSVDRFSCICISKVHSILSMKVMFLMYFAAIFLLLKKSDGDFENGVKTLII